MSGFRSGLRREVEHNKNNDDDELRIRSGVKLPPCLLEKGDLWTGEI